MALTTTPAPAALRGPRPLPAVWSGTGHSFQLESAVFPWSLRLDSSRARRR